MSKMKPQTSEGTARKFWNVYEADADSAEITLYGDVCAAQPTDWLTGETLPGLYITPEGFMEDLERVKTKGNITVRLNSCGGDLYTGIAIHNALKGLAGRKTVIVEGIAASAASVIMCAGDDVQVYPGSMVMIHGVAGLFDYYMTIADLKKAVKSFDAAEQAIAAIYSAKTGADAETLRGLMAKETWFVGNDAVERGFANTLLEDNGIVPALSADKRCLLVAGIRHDVHTFTHIPDHIPIQADVSAAETPVAEIITPPTGGKKSKGGNTTMNETELRAQYPELIAQVESNAARAARDEATQAERARIEAIDEIGTQITNATLVREAKYGPNACTAEQLAFRSMQDDARRGATHLSGLAADAVASGAQNVGAEPNGGNGVEVDDDKRELDVIADAYGKIKH